MPKADKPKADKPKADKPKADKPRRFIMGWDQQNLECRFVIHGSMKPRDEIRMPDRLHMVNPERLHPKTRVPDQKSAWLGQSCEVWLPVRIINTDGAAPAFGKVRSSPSDSSDESDSSKKVGSKWPQSKAKSGVALNKANRFSNTQPRAKPEKPKQNRPLGRNPSLSTRKASTGSLSASPTGKSRQMNMYSHGNPVFYQTRTEKLFENLTGDVATLAERLKTMRELFIKVQSSASKWTDPELMAKDVIYAVKAIVARSSAVDMALSKAAHTINSSSRLSMAVMEPTNVHEGMILCNYLLTKIEAQNAFFEKELKRSITSHKNKPEVLQNISIKTFQSLKALLTQVLALTEGSIHSMQRFIMHAAQQELQVTMSTVHMAVRWKRKIKPKWNLRKSILMSAVRLDKMNVTGKPHLSYVEKPHPPTPHPGSKPFSFSPSRVQSSKGGGESKLTFALASVVEDAVDNDHNGP